MYSKRIIERYLQGSLPEQEHSQIQKWLASLPEEQAAAFFEQLGLEIDELDEEQFATLEQKLEAATVKKHKTTVISFSILRIAAIFLVICSVGLLFYKNVDVIRSKMSPVEYSESFNGPGKRSKLILADGSVVWLNAASKLRFPKSFDTKTREVYLQGEAFFEVKRNVEKPFIVHSGAIKTQVLGTSFNVRSYPGEQASVSVATGKVRVGDQAGNGVFLLPGQRVQYLSDKRFSAIVSGDSAGDALWRKGILNFNNVSLKEAAATLERWYGIKIIIQNQKMQQCMLAGEHTNESLDNVLKSLQFILHFNYKYSSDGIIISGEACR